MLCKALIQVLRLISVKELRNYTKINYKTLQCIFYDTLLLIISSITLLLIKNKHIGDLNSCVIVLGKLLYIYQTYSQFHKQVYLTIYVWTSWLIIIDIKLIILFLLITEIIFFYNQQERTVNMFRLLTSVVLSKQLPTANTTVHKCAAWGRNSLFTCAVPINRFVWLYQRFPWSTGM